MSQDLLLPDTLVYELGLAVTRHIGLGVKVVPVHNQAPFRKDMQGSGGVAKHVLNLLLDAGEWLALRLLRFATWEREPAVHCGWVQRWAGGWLGEERKISMLFL